MSGISIDQALQAALDHHRQGRLAQAEAIYRQVLSIQPNHPDARHLLGAIASQVGWLDDAIKLVESAIAINPNVAAYHSTLGDTYRSNGDLARAASAYQRVTELSPDDAKAHSNLGTARLALRDPAGAVSALRQAVARDPSLHGAHLNLAGALQALGRLDESADVLDAAVALRPDSIALSNLGLLRMAQGRPDDAVKCQRRAIELDPADSVAHSNLLLAMNYADGLSAQEIFDEHLLWAERHARAIEASAVAPTRDWDPRRRMRVGYVSPDLKQHPVGFFLEPIITKHNRSAVEVFGYSDADPDALSERLAKSADTWRDIRNISDDRVAQIIRDDKIDILVDLAGHTARNRLLVLARKPAPVQAGWCGYVNTTGLRTIDYAITDRHLDPPGWHERFRTEEFIRLPRTYISYVPPMACPDVGPLPAKRNGFVTFGSLNKLSKVTASTFELWTEVIAAVPKSRLILFADAGRHLDELRDRWVSNGLDPSRLQVVARMPLNEYFAIHNQIDIALDPFPHNGGTTSCDGLWMGVPVVSLAGEHAISRAGLTLLSTIGLSELVADSRQRYVEIAKSLAEDRPRLAELRRTMRARMQSSPLMDVPAFISDLETLYRTMWQRACAKSEGPARRD